MEEGACNCYIVVSGEEVNIKRLFDKLNSEELKGNNLNLDNYHLLFDSVDEDYNWGSKLQVIQSVDFNGDTLCISGYSAWKPADGLWKKISKDYNSTVNCIYDEPSSNIAGETVWDNGEETLREQYTYLKKLYDGDIDLFWDEIEYMFEIESIDSVIDKLGDIYNNFNQSEIDRLNEIHAQFSCEDED